MQQCGIENIPVVILTAAKSINEVRLAYQNGASDFVSKSIDLPILFERLSRLLVTRELSCKHDEKLSFLTQFDPLPVDYKKLANI
ncbi:response regulator receiver [Colwellia psychrerythraea]|uniref:Response regulator receiver n=2 Tax=Colwellia psychrerythraea TaxID=28229 RepID=A0A099L038_COLPS|nr:response regulator receiver [Colwellia psychrerythraea]